jgi:hypothetical protein
MRTPFTLVVAAALLCGAAPAQAADRLNDPQLTQLVQNIDRGFDGWKNDLERRNLDDAVIKSAAGSIEVRRFLDDMEKDIDLVKDRLKPDYAAGPEVTALLRRASDVERRYQTQPGGEAWKTLSGQLSALAGAYGVGWPLDGSANAARRMDRELAVEAKRLADSVDKLRSGALRAAQDAKQPQAARDAADQSMRELKRAAEQLESNLKDHRAVTADATRVFDLSDKAVSFAQGAGVLKPDASAALNTVQSTAKLLGTAFGRP